MKTKVIFRKFKKGGEIIALFPRDLGTSNPHTCNSYMHTGQHASATLCADINETTAPARPKEYKELAQELRRIGYKLNICKPNRNKNRNPHSLMKKWKCNSRGHITEQELKPDVCWKCKEEHGDLWLSNFTEVLPPPAPEYPPQHEIDLVIAEINSLSHKEMATLFRFAAAGHPYFDNRLPYRKVFDERFSAFGGMTAAISKEIGLTPPE